jgi:acetyl esterase
MTLIEPFPADVVALRQLLIDDPPPSYTTTPPTELRAYFAERNRAVRERWQPAPPALRVTDVTASGGVPGYRQYLPDEPSDVTLVWYHGGGWVLGDVPTADPIVRQIVQATGWRAISVEYRLAPEHPFPAAVDDALAALDLVTEGRIVVGGDSAGGNLAAVVTNLRTERITAQLLIYPCVDPSLSSASAHDFTEGPFLTRSDMEWFYGEYLPNDADRNDPRVNLTDTSGEGWGPTLIWTVGHDPLRDEAIDFAQRLIDKGVDVRHFHAPELFHGCMGIAGVLPSAQQRLEPVWAAARELVD